MSGEWKTYAEENEESQKDIAKMKNALADFSAKSDDQLKAEHEDLNGEGTLYLYDDFVSVRGKNMKEIRKEYSKQAKEYIANEQKTVQRNKGKMATIDNTLKRYGIGDSGDITAVEQTRKKYGEQARGYKAEIAAIEGGREQYIKEAAVQIKKESKTGVSISDAVAVNTKAVSGNLYSMDRVKERVKAVMAGMKKSILVFKWRRAA
jgi:hypothetical protein